MRLYLFDVRLIKNELQESAVVKCGKILKLIVSVEFVLNLHQFVQRDWSVKYHSIQVLLSGNDDRSWTHPPITAVIMLVAYSYVQMS